MVVTSLEVDRARRTAKVDAIHNWFDVRERWLRQYPHQESTPGILIVFFLQELGIQQVKVPGNFPLVVADRLRAAGIEIIPEEESFWPQRAIKTTEEIGLIEAALTVTGMGMEAGISMIRAATIGEEGMLLLDGAPLTCERVRGEIHAALVRLGAAPHHTIVAGGPQGADPHEVGSGPLYAGQPIILDVFPRMESTGYWGDMTRTVCRGSAGQKVRMAWEAVRIAQEIAFGAIRAGVSGLAIHEAVTASLTQAGFLTAIDAQGRQEGFFHGTGHGLGLEIHEYPRINTHDQVLQVGHVITVEPGLYYPEWGGVRLEDVVVVEVNGCRNLTQFSKFLEI